eukprot:FN601905.1.p2 GENE.FN601905.1~~FN601905.1.p2  ORF type:complete len:60 (-),score=9.30 FN601905.1:17-196(-)
MTTVFPSMIATRPRPSQVLKLSTTNGCCGAKTILDNFVSLDVLRALNLGTTSLLAHLPV